MAVSWTCKVTVSYIYPNVIQLYKYQRAGNMCNCMASTNWFSATLSINLMLSSVIHAYVVRSMLILTIANIRIKHILQWWYRTYWNILCTDVVPSSFTNWTHGWCVLCYQDHTCTETRNGGEPSEKSVTTYVCIWLHVNSIGTIWVYSQGTSRNNGSSGQILKFIIISSIQQTFWHA